MNINYNCSADDDDDRIDKQASFFPMQVIMMVDVNPAIAIDIDVIPRNVRYRPDCWDDWDEWDD